MTLPNAHGGTNRNLARINGEVKLLIHWLPRDGGIYANMSAFYDVRSAVIFQQREYEKMTVTF